MDYIKELFQGLISLDRPQKSDKEVLLSIRTAIITDQKKPFETHISNALMDAVRLINLLSDENERLSGRASKSVVHKSC